MLHINSCVCIIVFKYILYYQCMVNCGTKTVTQFAPSITISTCNYAFSLDLFISFQHLYCAVLQARQQTKSVPLFALTFASATGDAVSAKSAVVTA